MRIFFQSNLDIIFFVYGLAFVIMGLAIIAQPRSGSSFRIASVLWLLGVFGITHGFNEWLDMWAIIKGRPGGIAWLDILRWFILFVSYYFLFEFGRRLLKISIKNTKKASFFGPWLGIALASLVLLLGFSDRNFWYIGSVWARYLLGLPGGILASLGFIVYYRNDIKPILPGLKANFYYSAALFSLYSLLGGLVVSPVTFPPGSIINTQTFARLSYGIPVQVFRTLFAVSAAIYIGKIITMFRWEVIKNLGRAESRRFTDKVTSSLAEMIMVVDKDFRIRWANKPLKLAYGADIIGGYCYEVTHHIDKPCHPPNDTCPITEVIRAKKPMSVIHKHFDKAGDTIYVEVSAYPMLDEAGKDTGDFIHVSRNVTDRIKAQKELEEAYTELKAIQEKLLSAEKMASLGKLSAGIAHEINNPIGYVVSNLSSLDNYISQILLLLNKYSKLEVVLSKDIKDEVSEFVQQIKDIKNKISFDYLKEDLPKLIKETAEGTQRVVRIIRDLKSFARRDEIEFNETDINEVMESALNIVWNEVKYNADVVKEYGKIPKVLCHAQQMTQALINIIVNAAQAIEKRGTITLKTYLKEDKVFIEISDTGSGMSEEVVKMVFEPFFTTKKVGEGTGLGLAIVYGIIQKHKGNIEIRSKVGEGTVVTIGLRTSMPKEKKVTKR